MKLRPWLRALCLACAVTHTAAAQHAARRDEADEKPPAREALAIDESEPAQDASSKQRQLAPETIDELLARYAHEPKVEQVVAAALQAERDDPQHIADMASRSRLRGLLPHIDVGVRRGRGNDLRWALSDDLAGNRTTADDVMLFATLRFDLDRLLFSGDEVSLTREARYADAAQRELIRNVVHVYFVRKRLLIERDLLGTTSIAQQLRIQETEALLDAFTAGAWKRMLSSRRVRANDLSQYGKPAQAPTIPSGHRR